MFTRHQKVDFFEDMFPDSNDFLGQATEWITSHLEMSEVYSDDQITEFAALHFKPDQVFNEDVLADWAARNGYVLESSIEEDG